MRILHPPPDSGRVVLGRTLPSMLYEALRTNPNPRAFNQREEGGWSPTSTRQLRDEAEAMALGLRARGLAPGDRVAFFTRSDVSFVVGDMACLMAGLVTVPVYLTHTPGAIRHILQESGSRAVLVSDASLMADLLEPLEEAEGVSFAAVWRPGEPPPGWPERVEVTSFEALRQAGVRSAPPERGDDGVVARGAVDAMLAPQTAADLATIIYTSGTTGLPKGVMLTHENLSSNVIAALTGLPTFRPGEAETALSFLPLTHVLARTLQYGLMWFGASIYYSDPARLTEDFVDVRPTFFASVPRVLEKAFDRILAVGSALTGPRRALFDLALRLARGSTVGRPPTGAARLLWPLADRLVYRRWRDALGGRVRTIIVGGAALRAELTTVFCAAGIDVLQGYGLTETSPVIAFNRPDRNRAGTVGPVLAGTEAAIADDGEVLARGPHVMLGYYRQPDLTAEVLDADGWCHTGDLGDVEEDADGVAYLRITGRVKHLFKLSTGKYVMPVPLEERIMMSPLVDTAVVAGDGEKYCSALLFVAFEGLQASIGRPVDAAALGDEEVIGRYRDLVAAANQDMPSWSTVKRFVLVPDELSIEGGTVTPKLSIRRERVLERYQPALDALYRGGVGLPGTVIVEV